MASSPQSSVQAASRLLPRIEGVHSWVEVANQVLVQSIISGAFWSHILGSVVPLFLAGISLAADGQLTGTLKPDLTPALPWLAETMKPAIEKDIAMLPAKPDEDSRVFVGTVAAVKKDGVPAVLVHAATGGTFLYVDANLNGRFEPDERFPLIVDREPQTETVGALRIQLKQPCGFQSTRPVSVRVHSQGAAWIIMNTSRVLVSGTVSIDGSDRVVECQFSCSAGAVDPKHDFQGIDSNGDGKVDRSVFSPESASAHDESIVFRVGSTFISMESVDLKTRTIVFKSHPASDYERIELEMGAAVPDFMFSDASGNARHLREFRGKYLLLDFWASWCGPCVADLPRLKEVYDRFGHENFEILGMNNDDEDTLEKAKDMIREKSATWTHAMGPEARAVINKRFRIVPFPTKILLDKEGRIISIGLDGQLPLDGSNLAGTLQKCGLRYTNRTDIH